jgi:hypothetical protein
VSDDGSTVVSNATDINFGTNLSVGDDGDGTVTVTGQPGYTDEEAQDAVGSMVSSNFAYDDGANNLDLAPDVETETVETSHGFFAPMSTNVPSNETETIASDDALILAESYTVDGTLTVDGNIYIL